MLQSQIKQSLDMIVFSMVNVKMYVISPVTIVRNTYKSCCFEAFLDPVVNLDNFQ